MKIKNSRNLSIPICTLLVAAAVAFCQKDPSQSPPPALGSDCQRFSSEPSSPQDAGQNFITGELKKSEDTQLTICRPDGVNQPVEVDESTEFLDAHGDPITLADFKTGDHVAGIGAFKNDVFVLSEIRKAPTDMSALPLTLPF